MRIFVIPAAIPLCRRSFPRWRLWLFPLVALATLWLSAGASAQTKPSAPPAEAELSRRIQAADAARASGNAEEIGEANQKVIAFALRELAHLRSAEHAYAEAIELYRASLNFEDTADTRADLAAAEKAASNVKAKPASPAPRNGQAQEIQLRRVLGASLNDLGTSEAARNQYGEALTHLQQAEKWNPATPGLARNLGFCAFKINDYPEAIRALSRALQEQPQDAPVRAMLGLSYFGTENYADATKTFEPLGTRGMEDASVGYAWAMSLSRTSQQQKAAEVLSHFQNSDLSTDALLLVGQLWTEMAEYEHAVSVFQKLLQRNPSLPNAHFFEGLSYLKWQKWNEAAADFKAELALNPGDLNAKYTLGFIDLQQGRVDEALALFNEVLAAMPTYANAQYQIGKILLERGQVDDAVNHLETAAHLAPEAYYIHYQLYVAYRKLSRIADANRELETYKQLRSKAREQSTLPE